MARFFASGEAMEDGDAYFVLVRSEEACVAEGYFGVNVGFRRDGCVVAEASDPVARAEWAHHRDAVVEAAKSGRAWPEVEKFMRGEPCCDFM